MEAFIINLIHQVGAMPLWAVLLFAFVSAVIQQFFPPYPSEILLLLFGCMVVAGAIPGLPIIAAYVAGTILSSLFVFYMARRGGKGLLQNKLVRRIFPRRYQMKAAVYVRRYGILALIFCKFIPGVNTVSLIMGGVMGLKGPLAAACISITGLAANVIYFLAGLLIGDNLPALYGFAKSFTLFAALIAVALISGTVAFFQLRRRFAKKAVAAGKAPAE